MLGFYPPFSAQDAESKETALPLDRSFTPLPSLAALGQAQAFSGSLAFVWSGLQLDSYLIMMNKFFWMNEWCRSEHVALPFTDLPSSDGSSVGAE